MSRDINMPITISDIDIPDGRREVNSAAVKRLADSIGKIGLRHPITVREKGDRYVLVAGRHRVEAYKKLQIEHIPATIVKMTHDDARLWEIAENLHRAELTNIEKAACIDEWRNITEKAVSHDVTPAGGKQPTESGIRKTAEALGVSNETVRRARQITSIDDDAKAIATEVGLTSVDELVEVSRAPSGQQAAKVHELAVKRASNHPKDDHERSMEWRRSFERIWNQSPNTSDREWARTWIDNPIMDERFA